jgi:hypothetical protein
MLLIRVDAPLGDAGSREAMAYQTNKRDASLGLALMASVVCGVGVFLCSLQLFFYLALRSGVVKLHLFEYPPRSHAGEVAAIWGCVGLSIVSGILVMRVVFRWGIRFFD